MPTNIELSKELELIRARLDREFEKKNDQLLEAISNEVAKAVAKSVSKEVEEMTKGMTYMNSVFEELKTKCEAVLRENAEIRAENVNLKGANEILQHKINQLEQYSRANNIEIRGLPMTKDENCVAVLQSIGTKINCPLNANDIDISHRVPTANKCQTNLIVKFVTRTKKLEFQKKAQMARLNTNSLGYMNEKQSPVFFNDHLSPFNKKLFAEALRLKKEKNWRFLWTDQGVIKARRDTGTPVFRLLTTDDLKAFN